jgi:hypothetical protein
MHRLKPPEVKAVILITVGCSLEAHDHERDTGQISQNEEKE